MVKLDAGTTLKRLRNRYRLVVMNEDTYEEVITFKLSRLSVYIALSILFVLLVGLTTALIAFTPLKLYIPGYGDGRQDKEVKAMKMRADSIENKIIYQNQYMDNIQKILKGNIRKQDTTLLKIPAAETSRF